MEISLEMVIDIYGDLVNQYMDMIYIYICIIVS